MIVFYEMTRACDLACRHCRADAQSACDPAELSTADAKRLIDQLTQFPKPPLLVLTGGDPIKRPDVFEIIDYARTRGLAVAMTPSATPLMTTNVVRRLKDAGLHRLAVSLDGADVATHDGFRRVAGSYDRTLQILADAHAAGLPSQINTTVGRHNVHQIDAIADLLANRHIDLWSVFFLVPTGRAEVEQCIPAEQYEEVFEKLWRHSAVQPYAIKTTEAPHYRRFLLQKAQLERKAGGQSRPITGRNVGTNDGKGILFVSHIGEIYPSGFLPILCGRFPFESVVRVYRDSKLFQALRDGDRLGGKCGVCEYRNLCGGSRSRAFGVSGDPLATEPHCVYVPAQSPRESAPAATDV
jgi:radical SAM protein